MSTNEDAMIDRCGRWDICQGPYGPYVVDVEGNAPDGWWVSGYTSDRHVGRRLHCGCVLRPLQIHVIESHGETWCVPHFTEALADEEESRHDES